MASGRTSGEWIVTPREAGDFMFGDNVLLLPHAASEQSV
jgi:hypothetical protein